jgi:hypothetical protein
MLSKSLYSLEKGPRSFGLPSGLKMLFQNCFVKVRLSR